MTIAQWIHTLLCEFHDRVIVISIHGAGSRISVAVRIVLVVRNTDVTSYAKYE